MEHDCTSKFFFSVYGRNPGAGPSNEREWNLTAGFATGICHKNLPQEFAARICRKNLMERLLAFYETGRRNE
jgi:hypothetical protein